MRSCRHDICRGGPAPARSRSSGFKTTNLTVSYLTAKINAEPKKEDAKERTYSRDFEWGHKKTPLILVPSLRRAFVPPRLATIIVGMTRAQPSVNARQTAMLNKPSAKSAGNQTIKFISVTPRIGMLSEQRRLG
jgi:hypothetical protein